MQLHRFHRRQSESCVCATLLIILVSTMATLASGQPSASLTTLPGAATAIGANARGDVWALSNDSVTGGYKIWRWTNGSWQNIPGGGVRIAVDPDGTAWVVTNLGAIFHSNAAGQFARVPGSASDIAVGANGALWALSSELAGNDHPIGYAVFQPGTRNISKWQVVPGDGTRVAVDPNGNPWVVTSQGGIYRLENGVWRPMPGQAKAISVGADGTPYAIATAPTGVGGSALYVYRGTNWTQLNAMGENIAAGPAGTVYIAQDSSTHNAILRYGGSGSQPATTTVASGAPAPTPAPTTPSQPSTTPSAPATTSSTASNSPANSVLTAQGWTLLPGAAMDVGANGKNDVWVISATPVQGGYAILHWVSGKWQIIPGGAVRISVDPDGTAWVVNNTGNIYHSNLSGQWTMQPGTATDIGVGANGDVWVIGTDRSGNDYGIYKAVFSAGTRNVSSWQKVAGGAVRIAVGPDGSPWVVNSAGNIYYMQNGNWVQTAINGMQDVSIGPDGTPYLVAAGQGGGAVLRLSPNQLNAMSANQAATAWMPLPFSAATATNIAAGASGTIYITRDASNGNAILSKNGLPVASPTLAANAQAWTPPSATQTASGSNGAVPIPSNMVTVTVPQQPMAGGQPNQLTLNNPGSISVGPGMNGVQGSSKGGNQTPGTLVLGQPPVIGSGAGSLVSTSSNQPLQVTGMPYVAITPPAGAVQLVPNLVYNKYVYVPGQLLCSDSANLGLSKGLAACGTTDAGYIGPYTLNTDCPSGSFYDTENGGECWQCPQPNDGRGTYIRSADPVTSGTACWRVHPDGSNDATAAIFVQYNGCPDPASTTVFPDARTPGQPFLDIASGITVANNSGGACWTCPNSDAQGNYLYTDRNANTLIGSQTGSSCTATHSCNNGCTVHFKYTPGAFVEPGLSGLAGARDVLIQEQIFQRPTALTTYLYGVAQANNRANPAAWVAAQWQDISVHPYGNPQIKALVHQFMIGDAPDIMYASGVQGQESTDAQNAHTMLVNAFQEYIQAQNTYVAQQALDMYHAWKNDVAAQQANQAQSELVSEFNYGTVPFDFQSIVANAMGPNVGAAGIVGTIVAAQRYVAIVDAMKARVFANSNSNLTSAARNFRVSNLLDNLFKSGGGGEADTAGDTGSYIGRDFSFGVKPTGNPTAALSAEVAGETPEEAAADSAAILSAQINLVSGPVGIALAGVTFAAMAIQQEVEIAQAEPNLLKAKSNAMQPVVLTQMLQLPNGPDRVATFWANATGIPSEPGDQTDIQVRSAAQSAYQAALSSNFATLGPPAPPPQAYTKFMNVSAGFISLLSSITSAPTAQNTQQIQTVMPQYTQAEAQLQGVTLTSDQQNAVKAQQQQVNTQLQRVRSLPGGAQATRKKLPGED